MLCMPETGKYHLILLFLTQLRMDASFLKVIRQMSEFQVNVAAEIRAAVDSVSACCVGK